MLGNYDLSAVSVYAGYILAIIYVLSVLSVHVLFSLLLYLVDVLLAHDVMKFMFLAELSEEEAQDVLFKQVF